jgi:phosphonopyruvate decarboxylase
MINCKAFYDLLKSHDIDFFAGVPDSLLKDICAYITDNTSKTKNVITANEGGAVALCAGYHLATGKIGMVYMQNSGQGNAVNPLLSLMDKDVYNMPVLLMIGWRGEPGKHDEPQHVKQGKVTVTLLDTLGIPYIVLPDTLDVAQPAVEALISDMKSSLTPHAIVIRKGTFEPYKLLTKKTSTFEMTREDAVQLVADSLGERDVIVSTTGMTSRELFEYREAKGLGHAKDFLTVGSMGHSSQIALGIALAQPDREVYCLDGDGAVIMHMGSLAIIAQQNPQNLKHIVINNGAHDSVGGQPTVALEIDLPSIARSCGYKSIWSAETRGEAAAALMAIRNTDGPALLEIRVRKGHRENLGRPTTTAVENKAAFMEFLRGE